jgi:hypothetical protein
MHHDSNPFPGGTFVGDNVTQNPTRFHPKFGLSIASSTLQGLNKQFTYQTPAAKIPLFFCFLQGDTPKSCEIPRILRGKRPYKKKAPDNPTLWLIG